MKFKDYINLFRIQHWAKNLFLFVALVFSRNLMNSQKFFTVLSAFFLFSVVASSVYLFNDIIDFESDKLHPVKSKRPIASGLVSRNAAFRWFFFLLGISIVASFEFNWEFQVILLGYFLLNIFYSLWLKRIVILDLFSIAGGFILRIVAGAAVIDVYVSKWLILTTIFISLFLAVMKRRAELISADENDLTRQSLKFYGTELIEQISAVTSAGVIICYALYTVAQRTTAIFHTEMLVYTTIFVIFGIFRYQYLVYNKERGENPLETLLKDLPSIINILFYIVFVILIIY